MKLWLTQALFSASVTVGLLDYIYIYIYIHIYTLPKAKHFYKTRSWQTDIATYRAAIAAKNTR